MYTPTSRTVMATRAKAPIVRRPGTTYWRQHAPITINGWWVVVPLGVFDLWAIGFSLLKAWQIWGS